MTSLEVPLFAQSFYFLRHGETEHNRLQLIAGSTDVEFNDTGRAQAQAAIELVRPLDVTHVVSSGLRRARDTAAIISEALRLPHTVVAGLAERNWGALEGRPQTLRERGVTPPGAETADQFMSRTRLALAQIEARNTSLIIAHSGTFRVLCRLLALDAPGEAIANCHPVRFTPPAQPGGAWSVEII